jgi:hypothetical protein
MQIRQQPGTVVEMDPSLWFFKGIHADANANSGRLSRLHIQQQLTPDAVRIVVQKLFEVEHMLAQPGSLYGGNNGSDAFLGSLTPRGHIGIGADEHFFSGIPDSGPHFPERFDIARSNGTSGHGRNDAG